MQSKIFKRWRQFPARGGWHQAVQAVLTLFLLGAAGNTGAQTNASVTTIGGGNLAVAPYSGYLDTNTLYAKFKQPAGLALDPSGNYLFVADTSNNVIRVVSSPGASGSKTTTFSNSFTPSVTAGISRPIAVAVDGSTNIFVLNRASGNNGTLLEYNAVYLGYPSLVATNASGLTNATAMARDGMNNFFVTVRSNTVLRITLPSTVAVVGIITNAGTSLQGIAVMDNGQLALTDAGNHGIWLMTPNAANPTNNVTPLAGFKGAGDNADVWPVPAPFAYFNHPTGLSKAGNGVLVVADNGNQRVKLLDTVAGTVSLLYGVKSNLWLTGQTIILPGGNYTDPGGWLDGPGGSLQGAAESRLPNGVLVAPDGSVFASEDYYHLLRHITGTGLTPPPPAPPGAPTILAVSTNYGQVALTWSTVSSATNYNVKRSQSSGSEVLIASTAATSYTDTNVINGNTYFYVVSAANGGGEGPNSAEVSATLPLPPVPSPQIGYVDFPASANPAYSSVFHPVSSFIFNNDAPPYIVIVGAAGSQTYYNLGTTLINHPPTNGIPDPTSASASAASGYQDGLLESQVASLAIKQILPDMTIRAIGKKVDGSPDSAIVQARFQYITGNPQITGNNASQFTINDITSGAYFYYTTDGSDPRTNASAPQIGPISGTNGITLSLPFPPNTNSMLFQIVAVKPNYQISSVVSQVFSISNFVANIISFGFGSGEASSEFVASPGQTFYAPVTLSLLPNTVMYSLQFNLTVTNAGPNPGPAVAPNAYGFNSFLEKPIPDSTPVAYTIIPPAMFVSGTGFTNLLTYNTNLNLLGVGWVERAGKTNLYNTLNQDLIQFSQAHDVQYLQAGGQVEVGGFQFTVPGNAPVGSTYQIQIGRPSATSDGVGAPGSDVFIAAPTNGSTAGGSPVNALKYVTVSNAIKYIVGSVYPFRWFNAGDFGSSNIVNADVEQVFEAAVYSLNAPPPNSDFFDAMDSCGNYGYPDGNGYYTNSFYYPYQLAYASTNYTIYVDTNGVQSAPVPTSVTTNFTIILLTTDHYTATYFNTYIQQLPTAPPTYTTNISPASYAVAVTPGASDLFNGNDTDINQIAFGDGVLDVCDVYVTFRRSLDPSLYWFERYWSGGQRVADTGAPNIANHLVTQPVATSSVRPKNSSSGSSVPPQVNFTAGDITNCSAGQVVQIPISATIYGGYPLRVLMLNLTVTPLDGSPALTTPVHFNQTATVLGTPFSTDSTGIGNYAAVWLNSTNAGLTGTVTLGTLTVTIPAGVSASSAYAIHFDHASASPNGIASFPKQTLTGLITLSGRTGSSYGDGIPDAWRLRWFGTVNNLLSVSNACPTGDGINNWMKYVAGVDPNTANNFPSLNAKTPVPSGYAMAIHWPTVSGKQYVIERSSFLFSGSWTAIATNTGTGSDMEFDDNTKGSTHFYRVQILP